MNITYSLIALGFLLFCLYMLRHALVNYRTAKESNDWLPASGKITELRLWGKRRVDGEMVDCENVNIKFHYDVDGNLYVGNRVSFYTLHYPETIDFAKRHPAGSNISVFYNPKNPAESVVVPGLHPQKPNSEIWLASIGVVIGLAVFAGVVFGEFK